jgi:hypothetical protein
MLTIMEENQKNKDLEGNEENDNELLQLNEVIENGSESVITALKVERRQKDLTFVSSPLFADMILASFNERSTPSNIPPNSIGDSMNTVASDSTSSIEKSTPNEAPTSVTSESVIPMLKIRSSVPTKVRNLSDPSVSTGTTLEKKSSQYNLEVALLRREVELRKQISGYETSLLKCDRKKAVKIKVKVSSLKIMLEDIISDAADARSSYEKSVDEDSAEVKNSVSIDSKESLETGLNTAEYDSVVDRGIHIYVFMYVYIYSPLFIYIYIYIYMALLSGMFMAVSTNSNSIL